MTTRDCVTCGTPITVTSRNPNRRFCSPRCRSAALARPQPQQRRCQPAPTTLPTPFTLATTYPTPFGPLTASPDARTAATNWPSSPSSSPPTPPTSKPRR